MKKHIGTFLIIIGLIVIEIYRNVIKNIKFDYDKASNLDNIRLF